MFSGVWRIVQVLLEAGVFLLLGVLEQLQYGSNSSLKLGLLPDHQAREVHEFQSNLSHLSGLWKLVLFALFDENAESPVFQVLVVHVNLEQPFLILEPVYLYIFFYRFKYVAAACFLRNEQPLELVVRMNRKKRRLE